MRRAMRFDRRKSGPVYLIYLLALFLTSQSIARSGETHTGNQDSVGAIGKTAGQPKAAANSAKAAATNQDGERIGVSEKTVSIGSCVAMTGRLHEMGQAVAEGANTYFSYVNDQGGIYGRKIKFVVCDDQYEPEKAINCFNNCLKDKVFAGSVFHGSTTIAKYVRMGETTRMPLVGFLAGTPIVYEFQPTKFTIRPAYADEVSNEIEQLWAHNIRRIAVLYQNDAFGAAVREAAITSLKAHNAKPIGEFAYSRTDGDVEPAFDKLAASKPDAIIIGATTVVMSKFVALRAKQKLPAICLAISPVDDVLIKCGRSADGIMVTQVLPLLDDRLPSLVLYRKLHDKYNPPGATFKIRAFESFLNAMVVVEGLKRAGPDLTRTKFVKALESLSQFDLGIGPAYKVSFSPKNHVGWSSKVIYLALIRGGALAPVTEADWKRLAAPLEQQQ